MRKLLSYIAVLLLVILAAADTVVFQPGDGDENDAYVDNSYPTTNYGDYPFLYAGANPPESAVLRSYLEFEELDDYCGGNYEVNSAVLTLYCIPYVGAGFQVDIHPCSSGFDEDTITWANKPSVYSSPSVSFDYPSSEDPYDIDVTTIVSGWVNGEYPNDGFRLRVEDESSELIGALLGAGEYAEEDYRPKLTLDYTDTSAVVPASMGWVKAAYK